MTSSIDLPQEILDSFTPDRVRAVTLDLAGRGGHGQDRTVGVLAIARALLENSEINTRTLRWETYSRLAQAIRDSVAHIPGMKYVEMDA